MLKKIVVSLTLALVLALGASASFAQLPNLGQLPPEDLKEFEKEGPLTQADIDAYIIVFPQVASGGKGLSGPEEFEKMLTSAGMGPERLALVMPKVGLAMGLAMGVTPEQLNLSSIHKVFHPSDAEVELVKNNIDKLLPLVTQPTQ